VTVNLVLILFKNGIANFNEVPYPSFVRIAHNARAIADNPYILVR
jgi:hypothetical protein